MKVADYIAHILAQKKVTHVFGVSGANIEDLYTAIYKKKATSIILAKNEYNACTMAIGSYLSTQKIAVVLTTSGPGILNTLPVLAEAFASRIPLVLISGHIPLALEGHGAFQDTSGKGGTLDIAEMIKQCSAFQMKITKTDDLPNALEKAFATAFQTRRPTVLLIPKDIFDQKITDFSIGRERLIEKKTCPLEMIKALHFCREFQREEQSPPLIILGDELIHLEKIDSILTFIQTSGAAVALTPNSKSLFDHKNPQYQGQIGVMGHQHVTEYLKTTDHIIFVGVNLDLLNRYELESIMAKKHQLVIKEEKSEGLYEQPGSSVCEIYGDIESIFSSINDVLVKKAFIPALIKKKPTESELKVFNLQNIITLIQEALEPDANVFVDAGNSGAFVIHHLQTSGMGGMGNSIGAGIGSSVVTGKKSYVFIGDGSFLMHGLEMHTALEYNLPVIFFIFNNNSHGMCTTRENIFMGLESGINNFRRSQYAEGMARLFPGIIAHEVNTLTDLKFCLNDLAKRNVPSVVSLNIANTEAPPFKTFIKQHEVSL